MTKTKNYNSATDSASLLSAGKGLTQISTVLEREMSPRMYRAMDSALRHYNDMPDVKDGIRFAVDGMLLSVIWDDGKKEYLDAAAKFFSDYFNDTKLVSAVHDAFSAVWAVSKNKRLMHMNARYAFYDKHFRVYTPEELRLLRREIKCPKNTHIVVIKYTDPEVLQNLATIKSTYQFYPEAQEFFSKYGFKLGILPIFVEKRLSVEIIDKKNNVTEEPVGGYYSTGSMNIRLDNRFSPERVIHELTHHLQWVNSMLRRDKLHGAGANKLVNGDATIKEMLDTSFVEAGALFAQKLYLSSKKRGGPKQTMLALLDIEINLAVRKYLDDDKMCSLKYKDLRSKAKTEFIDSLESLYDGLNKPKVFDVNESQILKRFQKDIQGNFGKLYTLGTAFAILTYASNGYDADKTMHDLIDSKRMKNLIYKLNDAIRADNDHEILDSMRNKLG